MVSGCSWTAILSDNQLTPIQPPIMAPKATYKFHCCVFQSKSKKRVLLPAPQIVQSVLRFEDMPKFLPKKSNKNMTKAINGPPMYQGQGLKIHSI